MAHLKAYAYPGWGKWAEEPLHYTQAIRVGDRIICSGQGGWEAKRTEFTLDTLITKDLAGEIAQAFENVDYNLKNAGGKGWSQVYRVVTYSTDIYSQHELIVENLKKWIPNHKPVWTELGVNHLGSPAMHFEIDVEAHDDGAASASKA